MIAFDLQCSRGHTFEGWFKDPQSFNEQNAKGMITCPVCKDTQITKVLSPVSIKAGQAADRAQEKSEIDYQKLAHTIVNYINNNFEDVGTDFAKEALKMHYGVADKRNIRGTATSGEEEVLKGEGIQYFKFPSSKKKDTDGND
ncbi:MAG: DUF1178 family protein [Thermodesulfobacteriota bacterium]